MIEFQRLILGDRRRNELFVEALRRVIVPGVTTVADLGSGTGFLSFVASRLGAKHCFLYEVSELLELSREIAKANRITNCTFVRAHSTEVADPPKVDVVVSETLGNLAFEENALETLQDARRFLAPGGTIVPQKLAQFVAPVVSSRHFDALDVWPALENFGRVERGGGAKGESGLDFSAARRVCLDNVYVRTFERSDLLDGGRDDARRRFDAVDFRRRTASVRRATVEWKLAKSVQLFGFALWWECELIEGVPELVLSTAPDAPRTHWEQIWLPPREPIDAKSGETLRLAVECDSRPAVKINVKWKTTLLDRGGAPRVEQAHDMKRGHLE
jgi:protein arginine N-methyltransferase 1